MSILLLFFDGVGIGKNDPSMNPFANHSSKIFSNFLDESQKPIANNGILIHTDANLGVPGLPQSATGQTTLFTGINAAKKIGKHITGYPTKPLRELLKTSNILKQLRGIGKRVAFANAYTEAYFKRRKIWYSATTWSILSSGARYFTLEDLREGRAVSHDLTNEFLFKMDNDVPIRTPAQTGKVLASLCESYDFCLFEHVQTDTIGHRHGMEQAIEHLKKIDEFLEGLLSHIDLKTHTVFLTSDHGNFENISQKAHTRNPVPTLLWGKDAKPLSSKIQSIKDITPGIFHYFKEEDRLK